MKELEGPGSYTARVTSIEVIGDFALCVTFDDGLVRELDLTEQLRGPVFEPLKDPKFFARVHIDGGTAAWANGADLAPEFLHGDFEPGPKVLREMRTAVLPSRYGAAPSPSESPGEGMPRISAFYGIVIRMWHDDHPRPHFHAQYAEHDAKIAIDDQEVVAGSLPPRAFRLVRQWARSHREELHSNWERARNLQPLMKIEPLE